uniref:methenyltetrahydrofolate cyclohydrolase n=1 Tax=Cercocebus atys TaxID=9531 RepID=A0A2K5L4E1_CERAT
LLAMSLVRAMATTSSCQCCSLRPHSFHVSAVQNEAVVISGRKLAQQIKQEVQQEVEEWVASGNKRPHLSMILVSENPASHSYVLNKTRAAAEVGINGETIMKPASIAEEELFNLINKLNNNVDGLLFQLPFPEHIDQRKICNDVDDFHVINIGRMSATLWCVWEIIKSKNVEMPIAMLLHTDGAHEGPGGDATVTISHQYIPKEQPKKHTILADIVITATGIPNLTTADMIQEGAAVINLVGDVDFEGVRQKAGYITPVPGGIGPVTVAMREGREVLKPKELGITTN